VVKEVVSLNNGRRKKKLSLERTVDGTVNHRSFFGRVLDGVKTVGTVAATYAMLNATPAYAEEKVPDNQPVTEETDTPVQDNDQNPAGNGDKAVLSEDKKKNGKKKNNDQDGDGNDPQPIPIPQPTLFDQLPEVQKKWANKNINKLLRANKKPEEAVNILFGNPGTRHDSHNCLRYG